MVEVYMLIANIIIAEKISTCNDNILLRVQSKSKKKLINSNITDPFY